MERRSEHTKIGALIPYEKIVCKKEEDVFILLCLMCVFTSLHVYRYILV